MADPKQPLRVYFDQNCINARGKKPVLVRIDAYRDAGAIELIANPRNAEEIPDDEGVWASLARSRISKLPQTEEQFRLDASPLDKTPLGDEGGVDVGTLFRLIFPSLRIEDPSSKNSVNDVLHLANAEEWGGDIFITCEKAILAARERVGLRVRILHPQELLEELEASHG